MACIVSASSDRSLSTLLEVEEPIEWEHCPGLAPIASTLTPGENMSTGAVVEVPLRPAEDLPAGATL